MSVGKSIKIFKEQIRDNEATLTKIRDDVVQLIEHYNEWKQRREHYVRSFVSPSDVAVTNGLRQRLEIGQLISLLQ